MKILKYHTKKNQNIKFVQKSVCSETKTHQCSYSRNWTYKCRSIIVKKICIYCNCNDTMIFISLIDITKNWAYINTKQSLFTHWRIDKRCLYILISFLNQNRIYFFLNDCCCNKPKSIIQKRSHDALKKRDVHLFGQVQLQHVYKQWCDLRWSPAT